LTFEGGKFSTSEGRGIFTDRALELLPADTWRWWLAANAPETDDVDFTVERFVDGINKDLADTFGNLVNRCLTFVDSRFGGKVPDGGEHGATERRLIAALDEHLKQLRAHHEGLALRKAANEVRAIWKLANAYFAQAAPWAAIKEDPHRAAAIARTGVNLVRLAALVGWPFIPFAATEVLQALGEEVGDVPWPEGAGPALTAISPGRALRVPPPLFPKKDREALAGASAAGLRPALCDASPAGSRDSR
jgi:methionyl-tRNA synthetase